MKIAIIGAGKMGTSLGTLLQRHQMTLVGYYDTDPSQKEAAAQEAGTKPLPDPAGAREADFIFLTTPDSKVKCACQALLPWLRPQQMVAHTSGVLTSDELAAAAALGCPVASIHPLQAVTGGKAGADNLQSALFTMEGNASGISCGWQLLNACQLRGHVIDKANKTHYHAAACVASNYLVTLLDHAVDLMTQAGFTREQGFAALTPLIEGTLENIRHQDTTDALTGPLRRGDAISIKLHLAAIDKSAVKNKAIYRQLGQATLQMLAENNLAVNPELNKILEG